MRDLNEVLDLTLNLPIGGKTYTVNPPPAHIGANLVDRLAFGIALDAGIDLGEEQRHAVTVEDDELPDFARQNLSDTYDTMVEDGLSITQIEFCVTTAFYAWTVGKEFAEMYWETGGKLDRPAAQSPGTPPTATRTRTAEATTTPTLGSPSGTTPPPVENPKLSP